MNSIVAISFVVGYFTILFILCSFLSYDIKTLKKSLRSSKRKTSEDNIVIALSFLGCLFLSLSILSWVLNPAIKIITHFTS